MRTRSLFVTVALVLLAGCGGSHPAAAALGPPQWEACRGSAEARARVQADMDEASQYTVSGTPTFFINGVEYGGLPTQPSTPGLDAIVTDAAASAQADATARGLLAAEYYEQALVVAGAVPVEAAPVRGSGAWVTIVEFSDFQCKYCRNAEPTLEAVVAAHPDEVRLVYKQLPLTSIHDRAMPAALAADCAGQQGKFWEMHDLLMAGALDDASLVQYAFQLGLQ